MGLCFPSCPGARRDRPEPAWLFGQPTRSFHLSELRRLTGLGSAPVLSEVNRLTNADLLVSEQVGNLRVFQANTNIPIFGELVSLTHKTLGLVPALSEALALLAPRLQAAWVFGSVAAKPTPRTATWM